jgi:chlorosome envelope protein B
MANGTTNDLSNALSGLLDTAVKLVGQSADLLSSGVKAAVGIVEPLAKTAIDLIGSAVNTAGQVLQNVTSAVTPKK